MKLEICKDYDKDAAKLVRVNTQAGYVVYHNKATSSYYLYIYDNGDPQ